MGDLTKVVGEKFPPEKLEGDSEYALPNSSIGVHSGQNITCFIVHGYLKLGFCAFYESL